MDIHTFFACLASLAHLQGCGGDAGGHAAIKADRLDAEYPKAYTRVADDDGVSARILPVSDTAPRDWQGFYIGASAGYGWVKSRQQLDRGTNHGFASVTPDGFVGGLSAGYNFLPTPMILIGLEADLGVMAISDDDKPVYDGHAFKPGFGPLWGGVRGRLGYLVTDSLLFYGTAGVAFMQTDTWTVGNNFNESSWDGKLRTGWTLGGGVEYALSDHWRVKGEFLYMDFGTHRGYTEDGDPYLYDDTAGVFRIGFNYRF